MALLIMLSIAINTINRLPQIFYVNSLLTTATIISMALYLRFMVEEIKVSDSK